MCVRSVERRMRRKKRTRLRVLGRLGLTLFAGVMLGATALSWSVFYGVRWDIIRTNTRSRHSVFLANGRVWITHQPDWTLDWENEKLGMWGVDVWSSQGSENLPISEPYFFGMDPYLSTNRYGGFLKINYATGVQHGVYFSGLIAGGLIGLSTVPSWVGAKKRSLRRRRGCCDECGYSLEGLRSDVCPECGEQVIGEHHE